MEDWKTSYLSQVFETSTWRTLYSATVGKPRDESVHRIPARIGVPYFFADNHTILWTIPPGAGEDRYRLTVLDIRTGERMERWIPFDFKLSDRFFPLDEGVLLASHWDSTRIETTALSLLDFSDNNREITRVAYATTERLPKLQVGKFKYSRDYDFRFSADLRVLAYTYDDVVVCRRTKDLAILWMKHIDEGLTPYRVAISANGGYVVASCIDAGYFQSLDPRKRPTQYFTTVFDGKTGNELSRLPLECTEGIAISPKGDLLAVVVREYGNNEEIPTVYLHDTTSGQTLTSIIHDRVKGGNTFLTGGCGASFTSDSKYLLTSGMRTKVWKVSV